MSGTAKLVPVLAAVAALALTSAGCSGGKATNGSSEKSQPGPAAEAKPHHEAGEESVERYGAEAEGSDRAAIHSAERTYLTALADGSFGEACAYLSTATIRSFERLASPALRARGCPAVLAKLLSPTGPTLARRQAEGKIKRIRVRGDEAVIVFHAPGARLWALTMVRERGAWKASTLAGEILAPEVP